MERIFAAQQQFEFSESESAVRSLMDLLSDQQSSAAKLSAYANSQGYKFSGTGAGIKLKLVANRPIPVPSDARELKKSSHQFAKTGGTPQPVKTFQMNTVVSDYAPNSTNPEITAALLNITTMLNEDPSTTFNFSVLLEAEHGNFDLYKEHEVGPDGDIRLANSWWTAARDCAIRRCGSVCIGALTACTGTWAAYLACVAATCGGCWLTCAACATCDCGWFCKPLVGCCDQ